MNKKIKTWISIGLAVVLMLSCIVVPTDVSAGTTTNPLLDMVPETRKTYSFDNEEGLLTLPSSVTVENGALVIDTKTSADHRIPLDFQMRNGKTYYVSFDYKIDLAEGQTQLYKQFFFHKSWGKDSYNGTPIYTDGAGNITNQEYTTFIKSFTVADNAFTDAGHRYFWLRVTNGSGSANSGGKLYIDNLVIYEVGASATFNFDNNLDLLSASHSNFTVENGNLVENASGWGQKVGFKYTLKADTTYNITVSLRGESNRRVQIFTTSGYVNAGSNQTKKIISYSPTIGTNYETKTASATFTTDDCANGRDYFWLWFDNPENLGKAYIDYVKIEVAGGSVSFVSNSGATTSTGKYGAAVEFPKAEAGYVNEFYLDEAHSIPVDKVTYPAAGETDTIYVKTKKIQVLNATFDNNSQDYSYAYTNTSQGINPTVSDNAFQTTVTSNAYNGVRFDYVLEAGKTYRVTMKYRVQSTTAAGTPQLNLEVYAAKLANDSGYRQTKIASLLSWTNVSVSNNYTEKSFEFTPTASHITDINKYFALVFYGGSNYTFDIAIDSVVVKEVAAAPSKPIVEAQTQNSVTLKSTEGYEYRIDGGKWQKSNVFTGLYANTDYKFEQRIPETDTYATAASEALTYAIVLNGDTNADKHISTADLTLLRTYLVGSADDSYNQFGGDSNSDGGVDLRDVVNLKKKVSAPMEYYQSQTTLAEQYYPVFIDNFDGSTLDASRWTVVPYVANLSSELGHQVHMGYRDDLLEIKDGILTLKMAKETPENGETIYHGSEIRALNKTDFSHGYVEMRAKLAQGTNLWNSFWLTGETRNPVLGEIDIFETLGINSLKPNIHLWWNADAQDLPTYLDDTGHWSKEPIVFWENEAGFHTYGLEWTDEKIVWYIDGVAKHTVNYGTDSLYDEFKNGDPLYLILSLSTGRKSLEVTEKILAETLEVDYIRIYQK